MVSGRVAIKYKHLVYGVEYKRKVVSEEKAPPDPQASAIIHSDTTDRVLVLDTIRHISRFVDRNATL
jgi:hypothetical protein